jgi:hypothetical protein
MTPSRRGGWSTDGGGLVTASGAENKVVCWVHKASGERGCGQPVHGIVADAYLERHAPLLPEFEFSVLPAPGPQ